MSSEPVIKRPKLKQSVLSFACVEPKNVKGKLTMNNLLAYLCCSLCCTLGLLSLCTCTVLQYFRLLNLDNSAEKEKKSLYHTKVRVYGLSDCLCY